MAIRQNFYFINILFLNYAFREIVSLIVILNNTLTKFDLL